MATNWLTCLTNLKAVLRESSSVADDILRGIIAQASDEIERYCGRLLRVRTYTDERYDGNGTRVLYLEQFPIIAINSIYEEQNGVKTLIPATDYHIFRDAGKILLLIDAKVRTIFTVGMANIIVNYTAGYGTFEVIEGRNDRLDFKEAEAGAELTATLAAGFYTADELAALMQAALNDVGVENYIVSYDYEEAKFSITTEGDYLALLWNTGANSHRSCGRLMGFNTNINGLGTISYVSDFGVLGIPDSLERACLLLCQRAFKESRWGSDRFDKESESSGAQSITTVRFVGGVMPPEAQMILDCYKRWAV